MVLKCIRCGGAGLEARGERAECGRCGAAYPRVDGVWRFVDSQAYTEPFGFQWNRFSKTQLDSFRGTTRSRDTFVERTGWRLEDLAGRRVLDAGCGMGRFTEIALGAGAEVHAADLSSSVVAARRNLGDRAGVSYYQADILNLPFAEASFDRIFSIGVLDHTPDTRAAFLRLCPLLKPGGSIAIWVYTNEPGPPIGSRVLRRVTPRLPDRLLLGLCWLAVPLYHVHRIPGVGSVTQRLVPTAMDADAEWRWLSTFDWYAPRFKWMQSWQQVEGWFAEAGLEAIERGPFPVSVRGRRPAREPIG